MRLCCATDTATAAARDGADIRCKLVTYGLQPGYPGGEGGSFQRARKDRGREARRN